MRTAPEHFEARHEIPGPHVAMDLVVVPMAVDGEGFIRRVAEDSDDWWGAKWPTASEGDLDA